MDKNTFQKKTHKVFLQSDLMGTRMMIGLSSLIFSLFIFVHAIIAHSVSDLIVSMVSFFHCSCIFYSLYTNVISRITYVGEAVVGFLLWNVISMDMLYLYFTSFPENAFSAPIIILSAATWWVMARYPTCYNNKNKTKNDVSTNNNRTGQYIK
jgi:hypothetical protein